MLRFRYFLWCAFTLAALTGCNYSAPTNAPQTEIRLAYFPNVSHAPALVGITSGAFQKAVGAKAIVVPRVFSSGPPEMEALLAGEVDMAYVGASPAVNAYVRSRGALHIVSGAASGGAVLVARQNAPIFRPEDLSGKRIGTPQRGSTQDIAARYFVTNVLHQKLSDDGGETRIISADSPLLAAMFEQKQLDAAWVQEPWGTRLIAEQNARLILDERDLWPGRHYATTVLVARTDFLRQHPDLAAKIVAANAQLCQNIEADKHAAAQTIAGQIKRITSRSLSAGLIETSLRRIDFGVDPYSQTLETQASRAFALRIFRDKPDVSGLVAPTVLKAGVH